MKSSEVTSVEKAAEKNGEDKIVVEEDSTVQAEIEVDIQADKHFAMRDSEEPAPVESQLADAMQGMAADGEDEGEDVDYNLKFKLASWRRLGLRF